MASPEWTAQLMEQLARRPVGLWDVLRACDVMPTRGFMIPNRAGDMQLLVSPYRVSAVVRPYGDDEASEDEADGRDALRAALRAAGAEPDPHGVSMASAWTLHYCDVDVATRGYTDPAEPGHERLWAAFARAVALAYDTRLCECSRQLCRRGARCFQCALDSGLPGLPATPRNLGELAKAAMAGSGGWTSRSERAGLCAIGVGECPERPAKQLRLDCGHVFCGGCLSRVLGLKCPLCRAPTAGLRTVYFA